MALAACQAGWFYSVAMATERAHGRAAARRLLLLLLLLLELLLLIRGAGCVVAKPAASVAASVAASRPFADAGAPARGLGCAAG